MKKNFIVLVLGSPAVWLLGKFLSWAYKRNPELFNFIAQDIVIPQVKYLITDLATQAVYRAVYGDTRRSAPGIVNPGVTNYFPYDRRGGGTPNTKHIPYHRVNEGRRYARY